MTIFISEIEYIPCLTFGNIYFTDGTGIRDIDFRYTKLQKFDRNDDISVAVWIHFKAFYSETCL